MSDEDQRGPYKIRIAIKYTDKRICKSFMNVFSVTSWDLVAYRVVLNVN